MTEPTFEERQAAVAARLQEIEEAAAADQERDREVQNLQDDEAWADALTKYGARKVARVNTPAGAVILQRPSPIIYKAFQDKSNTKTEDVELFVRQCLVHPSKPAFKVMLDEQPGILLALAGACTRLAGFRAEDVTAK